jgi:hypothetical protein
MHQIYTERIPSCEIYFPTRPGRTRAALVPLYTCAYTRILELSRTLH